MKVYEIKNMMSASGYYYNINMRDCDADRNYSKTISRNRMIKKLCVRKENSEVDAELEKVKAEIEADGYVLVESISVNKYNTRYKD